MLVPLVASEEGEYHQPFVFSNVTDASEMHQENAPLPMLVTLAGISIDASESQEENAELPMEVTELGIVIDSSEEQWENAPSPMLVPPVITTVFREEGTPLKI